MRGYPSHVNTKADFEYLIAHFPADKWKRDLEKLIASATAWFFVSKLDSEEAGVTDATHKVVKEGAEDNPTYAQYELRENPQAKIFRLGFTVDEVKALIAGAEN